MDVLGREAKDELRPRTNCRYWGVLLPTTEQKVFVVFPVRPSVTCAGRGAVAVSSLVSSVYVRLRSLVFGSMQRCRSRTSTVFGELLSQLLKIGRSTVRPRRPDL
jgi:hypothetical protein